MAKDEQILIKLSEDEKKAFKRASELSGIGFSAWARQILRTEAIKEYEKIGEKVPFLQIFARSHIVKQHKIATFAK